jgi:hypothetical protein
LTIGENMRRTFYVICAAMIIAVTCTGNGASAEIKVKKQVKFEPVDTVERLRIDFPYEAEFSFEKLPMVGDSAVLHLRLKSRRDLADTVLLDVRALPVCYTELGLSEISWPSPRRKKPLEIEIPVRFLMGGNYSLLFEQSLPYGKGYSLYNLAISFGVDGRTIFFGKHPTPVSNCPEHFYTSNMEQVRIQKKNQFEGHRRRMGIPYDIDLRVSPIPRLNDTSSVDFIITTNQNFIHDIQFQWTYPPTVTLSNLAESWGARPRAGHSYAGSFDFVPRYPGLAVIIFKVFGKNIFAKLTGKSEMEIPLTMIFDSTGTLLYFGEVNISNCTFAEDDPLRKQLKPALDIARQPIRMQPMIARSQPDFEAIERMEREASDSSKVDRSVVDSVMKSLKEESEK